MPLKNSGTCTRKILKTNFFAHFWVKLGLSQSVEVLFNCTRYGVKKRNGPPCLAEVWAEAATGTSWSPELPLTSKQCSSYNGKGKKNILQEWSWVFSEECTFNKICFALSPLRGFMLTLGATYSAASINFWSSRDSERLPSRHKVQQRWTWKTSDKILCAPRIDVNGTAQQSGVNRVLPVTERRTCRQAARTSPSQAGTSGPYGVIPHGIPWVNLFAFQNET